MDYVIIDIQGFQDNNKKFILKEIGLLNSNNELQHFIIKSPYSYHILDTQTKYTNEWLRKNHHGFRWSDGKTDFCTVINFLKMFLSSTSKIFVKGYEKKVWLYKILNKHPDTIIDLNERNSTSLKILRNQHDQNYIFKHKCLFNHNGFCSLENVYLLKICYFK